MRLIDADAYLERIKKDPLFDLIEEHGFSGTLLAEPTVEAIPIKWFHLLCKQLEDRCPPDRECIVSGYEGTCEECWKEWCRSVLNEG